jgi:hypothetical protein
VVIKVSLFYSAAIVDFLATTPKEILGTIVENDPSSSVEHTQRKAWMEEIQIMKKVLSQCGGRICFEYAIPRTLPVKIANPMRPPPCSPRK